MIYIIALWLHNTKLLLYKLFAILHFIAFAFVQRIIKYVVTLCGKINKESEESATYSHIHTILCNTTTTNTTKEIFHGR